MGAEDPEIREADAVVLGWHTGAIPGQGALASRQLPDVSKVNEAPPQSGQAFAHLGSFQPLLENYPLPNLLRRLGLVGYQVSDDMARLGSLLASHWVCDKQGPQPGVVVHAYNPNYSGG